MKIKKLFAIILTAATLMTCSVMAVSAAGTAVSDSSITVKVNGDTIAFPDQKPVIRNNRTLVPVRFVAEALGYDVDWNPKENTAVIDNGTIIFYIGTANAVINGKKTTLDVSSELIGDRTMIPLRIVAETLNCTVDWFGTNQTVLVNARDVNGKEVSVFDRYKQSDLFWNYKTGENDVLVWKDDYKTLKQASATTSYHSWWIERPLDKSSLNNQYLDCSIIMRTFGAEERTQVKDMLFTAYPTKYNEVYNIMLKTICGEIWETFYQHSISVSIPERAVQQKRNMKLSL